MTDWVKPALDYVQSWLDFQVRQADLPGLQFAVRNHGELVAARAYGKPAASAGALLTNEHVFRVASHSKTFTAAAIMKLVDAGKVRLDDRADMHVDGLHPAIGTATIRQLLSHSAGVVRDGADAAYWQLRRPFLSASELRDALTQPPIIEANTRLKYTNHGFGLLGLVIERVTGESYNSWIAREIVGAAGLERTWPDIPPDRAKLARGHGIRALTGVRRENTLDVATGALASATGFSSTASDLTQFFWQLAPNAANAWLSQAARREMTRRHWRVPDQTVERHYGLGTIQGGEGDWAWFGHSGAFPGCFSHTIVVPSFGLSVSLIVNSVEVSPLVLSDGVIAILRTYREGGAPSVATSAWTGRWWTGWAVLDLVPLRDKVLVAAPALANPMMDAIELSAISGDTARISKAGGFLSYGETAGLKRDASGKATELRIGAGRWLTEAALVAEQTERQKPHS